MYAHPSEPFNQVYEALVQELGRLVGEIIVVGDFNAHHPNWGGNGARWDQRGTELAELMVAVGMQQTTPRGKTTYRKAGRETVIDLTFMTPSTAGKVLQCKPREDWAAASDHIPVHLVINQQPPKQPESNRWAIHALKVADFQRVVKDSKWYETDSPLEGIQTAIQQGLKASCRHTRPGP